jgi:hypothetical protein
MGTLAPHVGLSYASPEQNLREASGRLANTCREFA